MTADCADCRRARAKVTQAHGDLSHIAKKASARPTPRNVAAVLAAKAYLEDQKTTAAQHAEACVATHAA